MKIYVDNDVYKELELVSERSSVSRLRVLFDVIKDNVCISPSNTNSDSIHSVKVIVENIDNYKK